MKELPDFQITVVGLGLMGGSLAGALRGQCRSVVGVARRAESGDAVSDAGPAQQRRSREAFEPCDEWPAQSRLRLPTDAANWRDVLRQRAAELRP